MKSRLFLVFSLSLPLLTASLVAQQAIKNLQLSGPENKLNAGATISAESGSTVRVKSGGTLQIDSGATADLPADIFTIAFVQGLQAALDGKAASAHTHTSADISDATAFTRGFLAAVDAAAARTTLGLGNVDNTSDANKPISTATQTALNLKANLASPALTGTPTAPTAAADTSTTQLATTAFAKSEADAAQAYAIQRANHTGTQAWSTLTGTPTTLSGYGITDAVASSRSISTTAPLSGGGDLTANRTLSIGDAAADGATKGAATFAAADFNASGGVITLDYTNAQKASSSQHGFLSSTDWSTFNNKLATNGSGASLTSLNASQLASGTVPIERLGSSGTPSSSTFLRGDNTWAAAGGPVFGAVQTIMSDTSYIVTAGDSGKVLIANQPVELDLALLDHQVPLSVVLVGDGGRFTNSIQGYISDLQTNEWGILISGPEVGGLVLRVPPYRNLWQQHTSGGSINVSAAFGAVFLTPTGNLTVNYTAGSDGAPRGSTQVFIINTSGTSSYNVTFGTGFKSTGTLATGTVSGKVFTVSFVYDGTNWVETSRTTAM